MLATGLALSSPLSLFWPCPHVHACMCLAGMQQHRQEQPGSPRQQPSIAEEHVEEPDLRRAHQQLNPQLQGVEEPQPQEQQQQQPPPQGRPPSGGSAVSQSRIDLRDISDRLEIISPEDVTLVKFLGAGGYGEVYLGKWHSSEAAIKCLNPSLFAGGEGGHVSACASRASNASWPQSAHHADFPLICGKSLSGLDRFA